MNELCRVVVVVLLLIDVQRGVVITTADSSITDYNRDDQTRQQASQSRCQPPSSDTLWLRLRYPSNSPADQLLAASDDNPDDAETIVGVTVTDRPATNNVDRRRHAVRHSSRRRSRRRSRGRLKSTAANLASDVLDTLSVDRLRRRGRPSKSGSERPRRPTAWQCGLEKFWRRTGSDVFPAYVQTGRCSTPTCMMGLYECRERRYAVGVLRRRRGRCVPLPATSTNSTSALEELWTPSHLSVVVACECSARRATGVFRRAASSPP